MSLIFDVIVLSYPLFVIRGLQMGMSRKLQVTGMFMLGGLYVIMILQTPVSLPEFDLANLCHREQLLHCRRFKNIFLEQKSKSSRASRGSQIQRSHCGVCLGAH